ncbi:MAG TPA: hypothetical protein VF311_07765 [Terriglobales bacterium]
MSRDKKQYTRCHHDGAERDREHHGPPHAGRFTGGLEGPNTSGGLRIKKSGFHPSLKLLFELLWAGHEFMGGINLAEEQVDSKKTTQKPNDNTLDESEVRRLVDEALRRDEVPMPAGARRKLIVKSVSAKQRPRRRKP